MPRMSKNALANRMYGEDFDDLLPGQKAAITRAYNAQGSGTTTSRRRSRPIEGAIEASIGRIGVNGVETCLLPEGATVEELIEQSGYTFDDSKESVTAKSTGETVRLSSEVVNGETYIISPEIKSA